MSFGRLGGPVQIREKSESVFSELSDLVKEEFIELIKSDFIEVANTIVELDPEIQEKILGERLANSMNLMASAAKVMQDCDQLQDHFEPNSRKKFNS